MYMYCNGVQELQEYTKKTDKANLTVIKNWKIIKILFKVWLRKTRQQEIKRSHEELDCYISETGLYRFKIYKHW
jgi:hypothetical protein